MFGLILKQLRESRQMNQEDLAQAIGSTQQKISNYENEKVEPDLSTLKNLADFFDVSLDYLLGRKISPYPTNETPIPLRPENILITQFSGLSEDNQKIVEKIIHLLENEEKYKKED